MELKGDQLKVTTSDLETTLVGQITVDNVESEGMIAAPAKQLLDSLKEFAEIPLTIDCNDQTFEIKLNWKSGSLSIPGASAVSYPALPALAEDKKELTFDVDTLVNGINKTIFATADDELRPIMNGVYINIEPASITFVATDAHKLVKYSSEQPSELTAAFILPKKPANLLKGMLLKEEAPVKVSFDCCACFSTGGTWDPTTTMQVRLIGDGTINDDVATEKIFQMSTSSAVEAIWKSGLPDKNPWERKEFIVRGATASTQIVFESVAETTANRWFFDNRSRRSCGDRNIVEVPLGSRRTCRGLRVCLRLYLLRRRGSFAQRHHDRSFCRIHGAGTRYGLPCQGACAPRRRGYELL